MTPYTAADDAAAANALADARINAANAAAAAADRAHEALVASAQTTANTNTTANPQ